MKLQIVSLFAVATLLQVQSINAGGLRSFGSPSPNLARRDDSFNLNGIQVSDSLITGEHHRRTFGPDGSSENPSSQDGSGSTHGKDASLSGAKDGSSPKGHDGSASSGKGESMSGMPSDGGKMQSEMGGMKSEMGGMKGEMGDMKQMESAMGSMKGGMGDMKGMGEVGKGGKEQASSSMMEDMSSIAEIGSMTEASMAMQTMTMGSEEASSTSDAAMAHETAMASEASSTSDSAMMESSFAGEKAMETSIPMEAATSMAKEAHATSMKEGSSTTSAAEAAATTSYGSGKANWGTDLNSCMQMCQAKFPPMMGSMGAMPSMAPMTGSGGAAEGMKGGGAASGMMSESGASGTKGSPPASANSTGVLVAGPGQVVVAPKKGELQMVPFAMFAETTTDVEFVWGAGPHTVTQSSQLTLCNATLEPGAFKSGQQNASFRFPVKVTTTEPTFYFCGVPTHCQKGMFGVINPTIANGTEVSVGSMLSTWASKDKELGALYKETNKLVAGTKAETWGSTFAVSQFPDEFHIDVGKQILNTRQFFAENPQAFISSPTSSTSSSDSSTPVDGSPGSAVPTAETPASANIGSNNVAQGDASALRVSSGLAVCAGVLVALTSL